MGAFIGIIGFLGMIVTIIMLIVRAIRKKPKKIIVIVLGISFAFFVAGIALTPPSSDQATGENISEKAKSEQTSAAITSESSTSPTTQQQEEVNLSQSDITPAFESACSDVGIDVKKIKNWRRVDDWYNGERYTFTYENMGLKVYFNYDGSVNSINIGNTTDIKLYEQGYEPYDIADYIVDSDTAFSLVPLAEEQIKSHLNYPSTANFSLLDWSYGRQKNTYYLQSSLTAKNGFGVKDDISFSCAYDVLENTASLVFLEIDTQVYVNKIKALPERKAIESPKTDNNSSTSDEIRLIDGQLGEYGKKDAKYPEYIDFYVPAGDYSVKNNAKNSIVMIIDDKSNDEVSRLTLSTGQSGQISIKRGQHIELTIYSDVSLTKK
jgi:hypothetical protein